MSGEMSAILRCAMASTGSSRRRPKITATLDPDLLASVDAYVAAHPALDRSAVIDEALRLWRAHELEQAMEAQFAAPDGVDPGERQSWDQIRRTTAARRIATESE
jgi:Arc/MetJ-type ribon-helix-helix transcriptional regulator